MVVFSGPQPGTQPEVACSSELFLLHLLILEEGVFQTVVLVFLFSQLCQAQSFRSIQVPIDS